MRALRDNKKCDPAYKHTPCNNVVTSGSVKRIGRRKTTPAMVPIGTDNEMTLGSISGWLCTSSAMLATIAMGRLKTELDLRLLIPIVQYV